MMDMSSFSPRDEDNLSVSTAKAGDSSVTDSSNKIDTSSATSDHKIYSPPVVAQREQHAISVTKVILLVVLFLAVIAVASVTYLIITTQEQNEFENKFLSSASQVVIVARETAMTSMKALESFSLTITSYALDTNKTWPFVSIPDWSERARLLTELTGAYGAVFSPIVQGDERAQWEAFSFLNAPKYYEESIESESFNISVDHLINLTSPRIYWTPAEDQVYRVETLDNAPWVVAWQTYPLEMMFLFDIDFVTTNVNLYRFERTGQAFALVNATHTPTLNFLRLSDYVNSQVVFPIFDKVKHDRRDTTVVGALWLFLNWATYFQDILTDSRDEVYVVLRSSCGQVDDATYLIQGTNVTFVGKGDQHVRKYDHLEFSSPFFEIDYGSVQIPEGRCAPQVFLSLYPTTAMEESFQTNSAIVYTTIVVMIFAFTTLIFGLYDFLVNRRQRKFIDRVTQQDKIVSNVFPSAIRDRLYANQNGDNPQLSSQGKEQVPSIRSDIFGSAPLAELYPCVTVVCADIVGFTAWASAREPSQVFVLLEHIYSSFDKVANRHAVFKVETVGDCYLAVAGIPEPKKDHAVAAARFAKDVLDRMNELTRGLEVILGPDTADLKLRIGLNSGQVTAGVLRGERARFQLFGDTVNTAARMENSCLANHIQISTSTADLLSASAKSAWITPRTDRVSVTGKGEMQTFWLLSNREYKKSKYRVSQTTTFRQDLETLSEENADVDDNEDTISLNEDEINSKSQRLVEWNVQVLSKLLQHIVAARGSSTFFDIDLESIEELENKLGRDGNVLDEFQPIICLKRFGVDDLKSRLDPDSVVLDEVVIEQLRGFVSAIASMYKDNPFHNFEHASHVTASVDKLLSRIIRTDNSKLLPQNSIHANYVDFVDLASHSYGITSDPLTQFAVVFSAIIHDLDHPGVPNAQLLNENTRSAQVYKQSIAEQNSVDLAWEVFTSPEYKDLRLCIYTSTEELRRFRQLIVNTVMATDIADKSLNALRKARWQWAFSESNEESTNESPLQVEDRKATIVIEHLIQASDVAHTMQHWHVFRKWNECLFQEMYAAFRAGRAATDPSLGWYQSEIGFFDFYVIPLAKKLDSCGVFGVSSDEYLSYAEANREEWVREGEKLVQLYVENRSEQEIV